MSCLALLALLCPELAEGSLSKVEGSKADGIFQAGMIYVT